MTARGFAPSYLVFSRSKDTAHDRADAQHLEEIPGDQLGAHADGWRGTIGDGEEIQFVNLILGGQHAGKDRVVGAQFLKLGVGEALAGAALGGVHGSARFGGIGEQYQAGGVLDRQQAQHDGVDQAEDGSVGADAQRKGHDGGEGEAGTLAQHAAGILDVAQDRFHKGSGAHVPDPFLHLLGAFEFDAYGAAGRGAGNARRHAAIGVDFIPCLELAIHLLVEAASSEKIAAQKAEAADREHGIRLLRRGPGSWR